MAILESNERRANDMARGARSLITSTIVGNVGSNMLTFGYLSARKSNPLFGPSRTAKALGVLGMGLGTGLMLMGYGGAIRTLLGGGDMLHDRSGRRNIAGIPFI